MKITRDEIENMQAGKQIDRLIEKHIMKVTLFGFHPSTNITSAWQVVEKMREKYCIDFSLSEGFNASFLTEDWVNNTAETMPLAICRAALLGVMEFDE